MALTLRVLQTTTAKQSTAQARSLPASAKATLSVGTYEIVKYSQHPSGHFSVSFKRPFKALDGSREYQTWFVWDDDVEFAENGRAIALPKDIILPVPFFAQMATKSEPTRKTQWEQGRTCNSSSCAMAAKYLGADIDGDDDYYFNYLRGDTTDHNAHTDALERLGIKSSWRTNLEFTDLDESLERDRPVVIGILHQGPLSAPRGGGHMVVVIGRSADGSEYICHDPYGSLLDPGGAYSGRVENGDGVRYPRSVLAPRWEVEGRGTGWGRLFYLFTGG